MPTYLVLPVVFIVGIVAGFLDATLGTGGLVSIPSLIFLGLPPQNAIATDRLGMLGELFTSLAKFWKEKKIIWRYVPVLGVLSIAGSLIGTRILLQTDPHALQRVLGIILLAILPLYAIKREIGTQRSNPSKLKKLTAYILFFLIMVFGGFFGQGTGPLIFFTLTYFLGFTIIEVLATSTVAWLFMAIPSLIVFIVHGKVSYTKGIVLLGGMAVGGYLGSHIALKKGDAWLKRIFILFVIFAGIKLLFF
jgi:uncharacterized protein